MRYGSGSGRGSVAVTGLLLVALGAAGLGYWRLRTLNQDLTVEIRSIQQLLVSAEEKAAHLERQKQEVAQELKRSGSELQHLQQLKDEDTTRCKHIQENLEQLSDTHAALEKTLEEERDQQEGEMQDAAAKLATVEGDLKRAQSELRDSQRQLALARDQLHDTQDQLQAMQADAGQQRSHCQTQLQQLESRLAQCAGVPSGGAVVAGDTAHAQNSPQSADRRWPGLLVPGGAGGALEGAELHAAARLDPAQKQQQQQEQQRVLPVPLVGGVLSSSKKPSSKAPVLQQQLQEPVIAHQEVAPGSDPEDGPGVVPAPNLAGADADDEPHEEEKQKDDDTGARDAALIHGLEELSDQRAPELVKQAGAGDVPVIPELVKAVAGDEELEPAEAQDEAAPGAGDAEEPADGAADHDVEEPVEDERPVLR